MLWQVMSKLYCPAIATSVMEPAGASSGTPEGMPPPQASPGRPPDLVQVLVPFEDQEAVKV